MKCPAIIAVILLAACDGAYVSRPIPVPAEDPCLYRTYHDPMCDSGFSWSQGYYDQTHVWITPRYVRRPAIVPQYTRPIIVNRPTYVLPTPRPYYRTPPPITTTTVRQSSPIRTRQTTTTTVTRRYR